MAWIDLRVEFGWVMISMQAGGSLNFVNVQKLSFVVD